MCVFVVVSNLFPANIRDRMVQDAQDRGARSAKVEKDIFKNLKGGKLVLSEARLNRMMSSDGIFGGKAVAELHPYTTVMVADLVGFTAWASVREPSQVFTLLELIFYTWDSIAALRRVFKVRTGPVEFRVHFYVNIHANVVSFLGGNCRRCLCWYVFWCRRLCCSSKHPVNSCLTLDPFFFFVQL